MRLQPSDGPDPEPEHDERRVGHRRSAPGERGEDAPRRGGERGRDLALPRLGPARAGLHGGHGRVLGRALRREEKSQGGLGAAPGPARGALRAERLGQEWGLPRRRRRGAEPEGPARRPLCAAPQPLRPAGEERLVPRRGATRRRGRLLRRRRRPRQGLPLRGPARPPAGRLPARRQQRAVPVVRRGRARDDLGPQRDGAGRLAARGAHALALVPHRPLDRRGRRRRHRRERQGRRRAARHGSGASTSLQHEWSGRTRSREGIHRFKTAPRDDRSSQSTGT